MLPLLILSTIYQSAFTSGEVRKERFIAGPPELMLYCVNINTRGSLLGCAKATETPENYHYAMVIHNGDCSHCRVTDRNVTTEGEYKVRGPHWFVEMYCPPDWFNVYGYGCYILIFEKMTWHEGVGRCEDDGASLATIESTLEDQYLKTYLKTHEESLGIKDMSKPWFWLAGNDLDLEGEWRWATSGQVVSVDGWHGSQPNNNHGNQHCMSYDHGEFGWRDDDCDHRKSVLCEV